MKIKLIDDNEVDMMSSELLETTEFSSELIMSHEMRNFIEVIDSYNGEKYKRYTEEEIREELKDMNGLRDIKNLLLLKSGKNYIKYINTDLNLLRVGGYLMYVDKNLEYVILMNYRAKLKWSVSLNKHKIFIQDSVVLITEEEIDKKSEYSDELKEYLKNKLRRLVG
jgi:hypothetical protein